MAILLAVLLAVPAAGLCFGLAVVAGASAVRRLRIVGEPPDFLGYEPPPPPPPTPGGARDAAAAQFARIAHHRLAYRAAADAMICAELMAYAADLDTRRRAAELGSRARAAAETARATVVGGQPDEERLTAAAGDAEAARAELESLLGNAATPSLGRRVLLLVLLLVLIAMLVVVVLLLPAPPPGRAG